MSVLKLRGPASAAVAASEGVVELSGVVAVEESGVVVVPESSDVDGLDPELLHASDAAATTSAKGSGERRTGSFMDDSLKGASAEARAFEVSTNGARRMDEAVRKNEKEPA